MTQQMSLREQYFWFLAVKDIFPILMARAIALAIPRRIIDPLIERYLDPTDPVAHPQCLVTGNDLMRELNLKPSRTIGELLTEIQLAQIESKIATFQQAIDFANLRLQSGN
jgi:tRNA nucleotidyltransferase (CCA-adding enzyme)